MSKKGSTISGKTLDKVIKICYQGDIERGDPLWSNFGIDERIELENLMLHTRICIDYRFYTLHKDSLRLRLVNSYFIDQERKRRKYCVLEHETSVKKLQSCEEVLAELGYMGISFSSTLRTTESFQSDFPPLLEEKAKTNQLYKAISRVKKIRKINNPHDWKLHIRYSREKKDNYDTIPQLQITLDAGRKHLSFLPSTDGRWYYYGIAEAGLWIGKEYFADFVKTYHDKLIEKRKWKPPISI